MGILRHETWGWVLTDAAATVATTQDDRDNLIKIIGQQQAWIGKLTGELYTVNKRVGKLERIVIKLWVSRHRRRR